VFFKKLSKINFFICSIFLIMSIIAILIEVFTRYFLNFSFGGNEEFARLITIYVMMIGGGLALDLEEHPRIDIFRYMIVKKESKIDFLIDVFIYLLLILFFVYFLIEGWSILKNEGNVLTPSLRIYWYYGYFAIVLGSFIMLLYSIQKFINSVRNIFLRKNN
jgi:TRAP-type transport system small permease protein